MRIIILASLSLIVTPLSFGQVTCDQQQKDFIQQIKNQELPLIWDHYFQTFLSLRKDDWSKLKILRKQSHAWARKIHTYQIQGRKMHKHYSSLYHQQNSKDLKEKLIKQEEAAHIPIVAKIQHAIQKRNNYSRSAKKLISKRFADPKFKKESQTRQLAALDVKVGLDISHALSSSPKSRFPYVQIEKSLAAENKMVFPFLVFRMELGVETIELGEIRVAINNDQPPLSLEDYSKLLLPKSCNKEASSLSEADFQGQVSLKL